MCLANKTNNDSGNKEVAISSYPINTHDLLNNIMEDDIGNLLQKIHSDLKSFSLGNPSSLIFKNLLDAVLLIYNYGDVRKFQLLLSLISSNESVLKIGLCDIARYSLNLNSNSSESLKKVVEYFSVYIQKLSVEDASYVLKTISYYSPHSFVKVYFEDNILTENSFDVKIIFEYCYNAMPPSYRLYLDYATIFKKFFTRLAKYPQARDWQILENFLRYFKAEELPSKDVFYTMVDFYTQSEYFYKSLLSHSSNKHNSIYCNSFLKYLAHNYKRQKKYSLSYRLLELKLLENRLNQSSDHNIKFANIMDICKKTIITISTLEGDKQNYFFALLFRKIYKNLSKADHIELISIFVQNQELSNDIKLLFLKNYECYIKAISSNKMESLQFSIYGEFFAAWSSCFNKSNIDKLLSDDADSYAPLKLFVESIFKKLPSNIKKGALAYIETNHKISKKDLFGTILLDSMATSVSTIKYLWESIGFLL